MTHWITETCCKCHIQFQVSREHSRQLRISGEDFWCPNGHMQHYKTGETEADKLRRELARAKQREAQLDDAVRLARAQKEAAQRAAAAHKGHVTRIKRRVSAGVCPCCNRTFENLARHMKAKHPDYAGEDNVVPIDGAKAS